MGKKEKKNNERNAIAKQFDDIFVFIFIAFNDWLFFFLLHILLCLLTTELSVQNWNLKLDICITCIFEKLEFLPLNSYRCFCFLFFFEIVAL